MATLLLMAAPRERGERERAENLVSSAKAPSLDPTKAPSPSSFPLLPAPSALLAFLWKAQTAFVLPSITAKRAGGTFCVGPEMAKGRWRERGNILHRKLP